MEGFKGTRGPWMASEYYVDSTTVIDTSGFCVADAPRCQILEGWSDKGYQHWADSTEAHRWISDEQQTANANLIAAAPDLLEALQDLFANYKQLADSGDAGFWKLEDEDVGKKAMAAIKKALGQ